MIQYIYGATTMALLVTALFFFSFWRKTRDRLFVFFSLAFLIMAAERITQFVLKIDIEETTPLYVMRILAFLLIGYAILDKNRSPRSKDPTA